MTTDSPVFLVDIDGVLNNIYSVRRFGDYRLDPRCVNVFRNLVETFHAEIVITSTRRGKTGWKESIENALSEAGWKGVHILDCIPMLGLNDRMAEINDWLKNHSVSKYIIFDDYAIFGRYAPAYFIKTSYLLGGLRQKHIPKITAILSR